MERLADSLRGQLGRFTPQLELDAVAARWPEAVGDAIARNAWPARLARDGTLHVNTADAVWSFELAHRGSEISARLGVAGVRFRPGPLPRAEATPVPPAPAEPSLEQRRAAAVIAALVGDPDLRRSVERAVALSLARGPGPRPV